MTDEELLQHAEAALEVCKSRKTLESTQVAAIESIAASLLVIARNSMPITTAEEVPQRPDANPPRKIPTL